MKYRVKDQYDEYAPGDLTVLCLTPADLTEEQCRVVTGLTWYQPAREHHGSYAALILVSREALRDVGVWWAEYSLEDAGLKHLHAVEKIEPCLYRWDEKQFYHA